MAGARVPLRACGGSAFARSNRDGRKGAEGAPLDASGTATGVVGTFSQRARTSLAGAAAVGGWSTARDDRKGAAGRHAVQHCHLPAEASWAGRAKKRAGGGDRQSACTAARPPEHLAGTGRESGRGVRLTRPGAGGVAARAGCCGRRDAADGGTVEAGGCLCQRVEEPGGARGGGFRRCARVPLAVRQGKPVAGGYHAADDAGSGSLSERDRAGDRGGRASQFLALWGDRQREDRSIPAGGVHCSRAGAKRVDSGTRNRAGGAGGGGGEGTFRQSGGGIAQCAVGG
ncbi:hypothetical protein HRbin16_00736 [bacterium HR16]|nr:hypothetical protein HRbin16_00736 [bacterium HR16]